MKPISSITDHNYLELEQVASYFFKKQDIYSIEPIGNGNINETYLVKLNTSTLKSYYILQKLSKKAFEDISRLNNNLSIISSHISRSTIFTNNSLPSPQLHCPKLLSSRISGNNLISFKGEKWRVLTYIESSSNYEVIPEHISPYEFGVGLVKFHLLLSDLPLQNLEYVINDFHVAHKSLETYDSLPLNKKLSEISKENVKRVLALNRLVQEERSKAIIVDQCIKRKKLNLLPVHGDPKINNFLFDVDSNKIIAMIDLDTVQPGYLIHDIGDCVRSIANKSGEESSSLDKVFIDLEILDSFLNGYFSIDNPFFTPNDFSYLAHSIRSLPFELGLRFLNDYLYDNTYFKTLYKDQNLARAEVQFKLFLSVDSNFTCIEKIIQSYRGSM
ncbi:aminoglycoside phosphotransferase family protein [Prochlorococcus sp. MIT 1300]|uniref:phosphotransferase enzyme family protein n=1 Tax=Prochlorococcus sp. MIT 1300 TaxID=3096218 RepID=UPI002A75EEF2|nr:aminoglycoside phosphotransferase family protein [Prochlorococcus sp. MIT 1300]